MSAVLTSVEQLVAAVYVSSATRHLEDAEILEILRVARQNNEKNDITGILLYRGGNFLQVLEGPASAIDATLKKIKADPRHQGLMLMSRNSIETRQFSDWSMAFRNMTKECSVGEGHSPFLEPGSDDDELGEASQLVFRLLRRFKDDMS